MSKKTRKKSPKASPARPARGQSMASAKKPSSKIPREKASKSGNDTRKRPAKTSSKASHKAASKPLKSPSLTGSPSRAPVRSKATAAKPETAAQTAMEPLAPKAKVPTARRSILTEGARAPAFRLPRDGGDSVSLSDYSGRKLVLFFYPRADTPGCTKEAIDFTRLASAFAENQTAILGVSADPLKAQESFRDKHQLSVPLISDEQHEMLQAYGAWGEKSMYGRTFQGILRTTVLIGADGRILKIWRNVKVDGHAEAVLAAARAS
jgi:thioredoxin-dependent peroxiredoxin